jgi:Protein of unknown function (DUF3606)
MADDKRKRGSSDRRMVAAGQPHEVAYFAKKHGISKEQTLDLIKRFGNDRKMLDAEAEKLKGQELKTRFER